MTATDITIRGTFLPHDDPGHIPGYRDTLGSMSANDVGYGGMRRITVGPADQPGTSIVPEPPVADPGVTDDERRTITEMMATGNSRAYRSSFVCKLDDPPGRCDPRLQE